MSGQTLRTFQPVGERHIPSPQLGLRRIASRVRQGGHDVPRADVIRRYTRGWHCFDTLYKFLAESWSVYDNSVSIPVLIEQSP